MKYACTLVCRGYNFHELRLKLCWGWVRGGTLPQLQNIIKHKVDDCIMHDL